MLTLMAAVKKLMAAVKKLMAAVQQLMAAVQKLMAAVYINWLQIRKPVLQIELRLPTHFMFLFCYAA